MKKIFLILNLLFFMFLPLQAEEFSKKIIKIGMQLEPPNLNPTGSAAAAVDEIVYSNIFEGLTKFKEDGSIEPGLAKRWEIDKTGLIYKFFINENVTFHNDKLMTANDIKFSLDRARAKESTNAQKVLFEGIDSVKVITRDILEIKLKNPDSNFLTNLAWGDAVIILKENLSEIEKNPIGTGPFKFSKWIKGDKIEIVKNETYWGKKIFLDKAIFKFISDPNAAYASILSGDLDVFPVYPALENIKQFQKNSLFNVLIGTTEGETILAINNKKYPFNLKKMRKAISHAINRKEIIDGAMFGYGEQIGSHFPPHSKEYLDLTNNSYYDPFLSKKLLKEINLNQDLKISLKLPPPSYSRRSGEIIASQLKKIGLNIDIIYVEWAQWLNDVFKNKNFDLTIISHTEPFDLNIYARPNYYFQYENEKFELLMEKIKIEMNYEKRKMLLQDAQKLISNDYVNAFLFQLPKTGVAKKKIQGLWKNAPTQANDLTNVYWEE